MRRTHFKKGDSQEKKSGARQAGVEPDHLAGITGFMIPPQRDEVSFPYGTLFLNKATVKKRSRALTS
ncbi:hypothetical protein MKJ01_07975 [Chryseobacterium sp. SSA4.19]|uniref:hypothetical protein n=1 Tax=Chryseobacterium sp. SSA4.19 TaxID=2919915 RepID=UPI001F4EA30A|nr:hypothetical protein [Chryseobacterium sp. SSA4.19]MCJ8153691.1 hypothetical protein [Chryseobacterium sp. SSA4.19]